MGDKVQITIGTDGFRDYVTFPDGRTFNLGSVSVLRLVADLAPSESIARTTLDRYLKEDSSTLSVNLGALEQLIAPPRARWAGYSNRLIQKESQMSSVRLTPKEIARASEGYTIISRPQDDGGYLIMGVKITGSSGQSLGKWAEVRVDSKEEVSGAVKEVARMMSKMSVGYPMSDASRHRQASDAEQAQREAILNQISEIERHISFISQHSKGNGSDPQIQGAIESVKDLVSKLPKAPTGQSDNRAFYAGDRTAYDNHVKMELELYIDNTQYFAERRKRDFLANIARKISSGKYDPRDAPKLWLLFIDEAAKKYAETEGRKAEWNKVFPKPLREALAAEYAKDEYDKLMSGEYEHLNLKSASITDEDLMKNANEMPAQVTDAEDIAKGKVPDPYKGKDLSNNDTYYKLATMNTALANAALSRVESTLRVVEASDKKGKEVAKKDLHRIATDIQALVQSADLTDPEVKQAFLDLEKKAYHVFSYFTDVTRVKKAALAKEPIFNQDEVLMTSSKIEKLVAKSVKDVVPQSLQIDQEVKGKAAGKHGTFYVNFTYETKSGGTREGSCMVLIEVDGTGVRIVPWVNIDG